MAVVNTKSVGLLIAAAFGLFFILRKDVADTGKALAGAVDITSKDNVASQLADKTTSALTGGQDKSLGDYWHRKCAAQDYEPWYCPKVT